MVRKNFYGTGNHAFACESCGASVEALENGSYRNHCPHCLFSKHVDVLPGDRSETCRALMRASRIERHSKKGWMLVHTCLACGKEQRNKAAPNDSLEEMLKLMH